jgi:tetratricopeptide (TPR) repeat protein
VLDDAATTQATLEDVLKRFAGKPEADLARGRVHLAYGRSPQAVEAFAAAEKTLSQQQAAPRVLADARTWLGRAQYYNNELAKARGSFEEAVRLDPSNAEAHYNLGLLLFEQDQLASARTSFARAVEVSPIHADAWFYLGDAARRMGDRQKAREAAQMYLKLAPKGDLAAEARRLL